MKFNKTAAIALAILLPAFLFVLVSQSFAQAGGKQDIHRQLAPLVDEADLSRQKISLPATATAGRPLTYVLTISNSGAISATSVVVTDTLPPHVTFESASTSVGRGCSGQAEIVCQVGDLPVDGDAQITLTTVISPGAGGFLHDEATVSTGTAESNTANNRNDLDTPVVAAADLSIGKSASRDPAAAGDLLTYNLVVHNAGPSDATGVLITDTLHPSMTLISATVAHEAVVVRTTDTSLWQPPSPDPAGLAYIAASDRLMVSDSEVEEPPFKRDENLYAATRHGAVITVTTTTTFTKEPTGLAYDPDSEMLFVSDDVLDRIFTVLAGPDDLYGTADDIVNFFSTRVFTNVVPEGLAFDPHRGHLYSVDGFFNDVFDIDPGADGDFGTADDVITSFDVRDFGIQDAEGLAYNEETKTIWVGDHAGPRVVETTVDGTHLSTLNLSLDTAKVSGLTFAPGTVNPNALSLYVSDRAIDNNDDPTENDGKIYEAVIPTYSGSGSCSGTAVIECDLGTVAAGEVAVVSIVVQPDLLALGAITNTAIVTTTTPDPKTDNNLAAIATEIRPESDLAISKVFTPTTAVGGDKITYTLTISNLGLSESADVHIVDTLSDTVKLLSADASQGSGCVGTIVITCTLGNMAAWHTATITIVVQVNDSFFGKLTNTAEAFSATVDPDQSNNTAVMIVDVMPKHRLLLPLIVKP